MTQEKTSGLVPAVVEIISIQKQGNLPGIIPIQITRHLPQIPFLNFAKTTIQIYGLVLMGEDYINSISQHISLSTIKIFLQMQLQ